MCIILKYCTSLVMIEFIAGEKACEKQFGHTRVKALEVLGRFLKSHGQIQAISPVIIPLLQTCPVLNAHEAASSNQGVSQPRA